MTMADNVPVAHDFEPHKQDYDQFVKLTIATLLAVGFILVTLLSVGFAQSFNVLNGVVGLIIGLISVTLTLMTGGRNWIPSLVLFVLFFLLTVTLF